MIKKAKTYLNTAIFVLIFAGCVHGQPSDLSKKDEKSIRSTLTAYANGWNADNPRQAIMSLFVEDAVLLPHHGVPQVEGKENIEKHFWPVGLTGFKVNAYDFDIMEITGRSELAYSRGRYSISFSFEDEGELRTLDKAGNYVMIFNKIGEEWKVSRYIWNDPVAQEQQKDRE